MSVTLSTALAYAFSVKKNLVSVSVFIASSGENLFPLFYGKKVKRFSSLLENVILDIDIRKHVFPLLFISRKVESIS